MPHRRVVLLTLLTAMLVGMLPFATPARADIVSVPYVDVGPSELPPVLSEDEADYIKFMQRAGYRYQFLSPVSPDGLTVLVGAFQIGGGGEAPIVGFLNTLDGSFVPVQGDLISYLMFGFTNFAWYDNNTLTSIGFDINAYFDALFNGGDVDVLGFSRVVVDRNTGEIGSQFIGALPGFPASLAPDGRKVLLLESPEGMDVAVAQAFPVKYQVTPPKVHGFRTPGVLPTLASQLQQGMLQASASEQVISFVDLETGLYLPLTRLPEGTIPLDQAWSPDGYRIAISSISVDAAARGSYALGVVATQDALGNLPPERNPFFQSNQLQAFSISEAGIQQMTLRAADGNGDLFMGVAWSPDGQTLMTAMAQPPRLTGRQHPIYTPQFLERYYARFYDVNTMQPTGELNVSTIEAPYTAQFITPDEVFFTAVAGLTERITYFNRASGEVRDLTPAAGSFSDPIISPTAPIAIPAFRQLLFVHSSYIQPHEVFRMNWDGSDLTQISFLNDELRSLNGVQANEVSFTLSNGQVRQGYLIQPAGAPFPPQQARIVLWQEGGPTGSIYNKWATNIENPFNLLPNLGISLLVVPLPGRYGWGPTFNNGLADGRNFGQIDIDESAEIARQLLRLGWAAPGGVGITGCSYGGYFTSQSIGRHPDLYSAAIPQCSLLDNYVEWQSGFQGLMSYLIGATPAQEPLEYAQDSPLYIANRVRTPTLIFHGSEDFLPVNIAETYHDAIQETGAPVRMFRFEFEGHGLGSAANQAYGAQLMVEWFRTYLNGE